MCWRCEVSLLVGVAQERKQGLAWPACTPQHRRTQVKHDEMTEAKAEHKGLKGGCSDAVPKHPNVLQAGSGCWLHETTLPAVRGLRNRLAPTCHQKTGDVASGHTSHSCAAGAVSIPCTHLDGHEVVLRGSGRPSRVGGDIRGYSHRHSRVIHSRLGRRPASRVHSRAQQSKPD